MLGNVASCDERQLERLEITWSDVGPFRLHMFVLGWRVARNCDAALAVIIRQLRVAGGSRRGNPRQCSQGVCNLLIELRRLLQFVPRQSRRDAERNQMISGEANIYVFQIVKRPHKKASAKQQQQTQADLQPHRTAPQLQLSSAGGGDLLFQRLYQIGTPELKRRSEAEQQSYSD